MTYSFHPNCFRDFQYTSRWEITMARTAIRSSIHPKFCHCIYRWCIRFSVSVHLENRCFALKFSISRCLLFLGRQISLATFLVIYSKQFSGFSIWVPLSLLYPLGHLLYWLPPGFERPILNSASNNQQIVTSRTVRWQLWGANLPRRISRKVPSLRKCKKGKTLLQTIKNSYKLERKAKYTLELWTKKEKRKKIGQKGQIDFWLSPQAGKKQINCKLLGTISYILLNDSAK